VLGITLFAWDADSNPYIEEASAAKNSLSEFFNSYLTAEA
jgi:hypothetical protein